MRSLTGVTQNAVLKNSHLRYVNDCDFQITRKKKGKNFKYVTLKGRTVEDKEIVDRINTMRIPPAWNNVLICDDESGHIQATGIDAKGRKQYVYHTEWTRLQQEHKFNNVIHFGEILPSIREQVEGDLKAGGLSRRRILATIVWLLEHTFIRIGNEEYAKDNKHYGLTTLRDKHVKIHEDDVKFQFTGKSGVEHQIDIHHPRVARIIRKSKELPGEELFQYLDHEGKRQSIHAPLVNEYLKEITGEDITAKDFRTWGGSLICSRKLYENGTFDTKKEAKKNITQTIKIVAKHLGNTPATCRSYYIHPTIIESYQNKILIPHFENMYKSDKTKKGLSKYEFALIDLLRAYPKRI